ncbi:unnamed protein product, partial [Arabidopsis halleri]
MERDEVGFSSKKRKVTQSTATRYVDNVYRLYFKGLVSNDIEDGKKTAIFGVAICDQMDELLIEIKELVSDAKFNSEGVDIRALIRGLSESLNLGIRKVVIYCDDYQIYQNIMTGKSNHKQERVIQQLMEQIQCLRQKFDLCAAILVAQNDIKFALKLAREAIVFQTSGVSKVKGEVCVICQEETEADCICGYEFCYECGFKWDDHEHNNDEDDSESDSPSSGFESASPSSGSESDSLSDISESASPSSASELDS